MPDFYHSVVVSFPHQSSVAARCVRLLPQCRGLFSSPVQCGGKVCQTFTTVSWSLFLTSPVWRQGVSDFYHSVVVSFPHQSSVAARCVRLLLHCRGLFSSPVQCGGKVCQSFTPSVVVSFPHQSSVTAKCVRPLFLTRPVWRQGVSDLFSSPGQCGGKVCQSFTPLSLSLPHQSSVAARCVRPLFLTSPVWRQGVSDLFSSPGQCGGKVCQTFPPLSLSLPHQSSVAARCVRPLFLTRPVWRQGVSDLFSSPVQCGGKVCQTSFSHQSNVASRCVRVLPHCRGLFSSPVQCSSKVCQTFTPVSWSLFLTSPVWRQDVSERRGTGREQLHLSLQGPSHRGHVWSVSLL